MIQKIKITPPKGWRSDELKAAVKLTKAGRKLAMVLTINRHGGVVIATDVTGKRGQATARKMGMAMMNLIYGATKTKGKRNAE